MHYKSVSRLKQVRSVSTEYFDLTFQTEEDRVYHVCFFPEMRDILTKFQQKNQNGVIGSVMKTCKPSELILKNNSTAKEKTLSFEKHDKKAAAVLLP